MRKFLTVFLAMLLGLVGLMNKNLGSPKGVRIW